jgi:predicted transposase YdaD
MGGNMNNEKAYMEVMESLGISDKLLQTGRREGRREGRQEGAREVITLLEKGYSLSEAKKKLQLA